jgi:DNA mismatch endonuclease (patch repair protein)
VRGISRHDAGVPSRPKQSSDIVSKTKRSEMMRAVGQRDTKPERAVREMLRGHGFRYRRNHPGLPGRPDFANRTKGWAIFVHGCFWHGHRDCKKTKGGRSGRVPATNSEFWAAKIEANRERDARKTRQLRGLGLRVLTVWECELRDRAVLGRKLERFLERSF